ncbi:DUF6146 family protein [Jejudonia soesokkakensis]|uniref:DUF6146 family protein n=1 Tax=Jejudonia soesokkakensis TaxID=1323432 RepID=A0ABW2MUR1_9FLAO
MKYLLAITILAFTILACESNKTIVKNSSNDSSTMGDTIRIANDSLDYEILIFEPGFNSFLLTQQPRGYYGLNFLENRNTLWTSIYNQRVRTIQSYNRNLYQQEINYEPHIRYGYEVNYLLYNYFLFFQQEYKQNFPGSR